MIRKKHLQEASINIIELVTEWATNKQPEKGSLEQLESDVCGMIESVVK